MNVPLVQERTLISGAAILKTLIIQSNKYVLISIKKFTCVVLDGDTKVRTTESIKRKFETFCAAHPTSNSSSSSAKSKKGLMR